jgi:hypothetical protein
MIDVALSEKIISFKKGNVYKVRKRGTFFYRSTANPPATATTANTSAGNEADTCPAPVELLPVVVDWVVFGVERPPSKSMAGPATVLSSVTAPVLFPFVTTAYTVPLRFSGTVTDFVELLYRTNVGVRPERKAT